MPRSRSPPPGAGLHVLCEKPLAANLAEARRVAEAIESAGVVGAVNYGRRFQQTRERVIERAREVLGRPRMAALSLVYSDHADADSRPFTWVHDADMGGGRIQGYGVHDLDLLIEALGPVEAVAAAGDVGVPERETEDGSKREVTAEDAYAILLRFEGGGIGIVSLVSTARHKRGDVIELHGADGTVRLDAEKRVWWGRTGEELQCDGPLESDSKDAYARVARAFHAAIRDGARTRPPARGGPTGPGRARRRLRRGEREALGRGRAGLAPRAGAVRPRPANHCARGSCT